MDTATAIATALAAYGALLSTFLALRQVRRDRRRVKVMATPMIYLDPDGTRYPYYHRVLEARAVNVGHRPVELKRCAVVTDETVFHPMPFQPPDREPEKLPRLLRDGESVLAYFKATSFDGGHLPRQVFFEDTQGRRYSTRRSRRLRRDIANMIEEERKEGGES